MFIDGYNQFDPASAALTVSRVSTNIIDLSVGRDLGINPDMPIKLAVFVAQTFTAAGAATLLIQFMGAPDNGAGAPGAFTVYSESRAYALADLVQGNRLYVVDIPGKPAGDPLPRFYQLNYVVTTGPMTAGNLSAAMGPVVTT